MQKLQLSIPEPCHENWHQMNPTQQGRFCNACAKEVIDFSSMTDIQVLNYFSSLTNEKVCGRVMSTQLDTPITRPVSPKKRLFWYWNYIIMFFMFFSKSNQAKSQTKGEVVAMPIKPECTRLVGTMVANPGVEKGSRIIKGKITDEAGNPVPFAMVQVKGQKIAVPADQKGNYSIAISGNNDVLEITAVGFQSKVVSARSNSFDVVLSKALRTSTINGEVVLIAGGIRFTRDNEKLPVTIPIPIALFKIKDETTGLPLNNVSVIVNRIGNKDHEKGLTDKDGMYTLKRNKKEDGYNIRVVTMGYEANEFSITGEEFDNRKGAWEVLLKKIVAPPVAVTDPGIPVHIEPTVQNKVPVLIYPNPVHRGSAFNIALQLTTGTTYNLQVVDLKGNIIQQSQIKVTAKAHVSEIQTGNNWSSGIYYIHLFDNKNKLISTSSFIVL